MEAWHRGPGQQMVLSRPEEPARGVWLVKFGLPWLLAVAVLGVGVLAHLAWGDGLALPWITAALTPAFGGLTWLAWTVARARQVGPAGRAHVAATVGVIGAWLLTATVVGPWTRGVIDAWGLLGTVAAVSWNLRAALYRPSSRRGDGDDDGEPNTPRKAGKALLAALGMRGSELVPQQVDENRVGGQLVLTSGEHTVDDAQKRSHNFATALGIPKSGVRFTENPNNAAEPEFSFTLRDVLGNPTPWPGPSRVGGTVFDPIPMGLYETGAILTKKVADAAGAKHELIQGTTGAGKSSGAKVELCELMTRREVALIVLDTVKGIQTFGPAAPGLAWFITETALAVAFMQRLMVVIKARTDYLGAHDLSEWIPGCGLTFLLVQVEEAGILLEEMGDEFKNVVKAARSAGISVKVSLQRPSHDEMPTTARAQLGTITCYGMAADDPVCLLPEAVQDAGADPRRWGDRQPGSCYVAGTGISVAQASTPLRSYELAVPVMAAHAAEYGPRMDPIDSVTIRAFGDLWRRRVPPVEWVARIKAGALAGDVSTARPAPPVVDGDDLDDEDIIRENEEQDGVSLRPEDMGVSTVDEDPDGTSIDDEITPLGVDLAFGASAGEVSVDDARRAVAERLAEIEAAARDEVRVPDFADLVATGIRSRAWFRKELLRLVAAGRLVEQGDGVFRIVPAAEDRAA